MKIFGQLKEAILERISGSKSGAVEGQVWYDTSLGLPKFRNNAADKTLVDNNTIQTLALKEILNSSLTLSTADQCSVTNPARLDVKKDTKANLDTYASTASNGQLVYATDSNKVYQISNNALAEISGGGASISDTQLTHGFALLDPIYHDGTSWVKAQANNQETLAEFVITNIESVDKFTATKFGTVEVVAHGLTVGEHYFLSSDVLGGYDFGFPEEYSCPLFYVKDADNIIVEVYRPSAPAEPRVVSGFADEIGSIIAVAHDADTPNGCLYCDGSLKNISDFQELYDKIGIAYGGDGVTNFRVPDFQGMFLRGLGGSSSAIGTTQADSTAVNGLNVALGGSHDHDIIGNNWGTTGSAGSAITDQRTTPSVEVSGLQTDVAPNHTHSLSGDSETRPINMAVKYYIRAAKTEVTVSIPSLQTDIVVGSSDDVARNLADYDNLQDAHNAASTGDTIKMLPKTLLGDLIVSKIVSIVGSGYSCNIDGNVTIDSTNGKVLIEKVRFNGNMVINDGSTNNIITNCWASSTSTVVDNNTVANENIITIMQEA